MVELQRCGRGGGRLDTRGSSGNEIRGVLSSLTELSIRGEYRVGADSAALDNVVFGNPCAADFNSDGSVNFFDISDFITAYNDSDAAADFAAPFGTFNFFDISAYISAYNTGCP
jgi:hypothetical protein